MSWLQSNWLKVIIAIAILTVGLSASYYFLATSRQPRSPSLATQAQCAAQAQKALAAFEQQNESKGDSRTYTQQNHYNQALDECFVLVDSYPLDASAQFVASRYEDLLNAYANTDLAGCAFGGNNTLANTSTCIVDSHEASYQQYANFVGQRMDIAPGNLPR